MDMRLPTICFGLLLLAACSGKKNTVVRPAFYHWRTHLQLTENERLYLDSLSVKKLFVKFFDVDWDEASSRPVPHALVEMDTARLAGLEIVPTVFITNRTLLNVKMEETKGLAVRIFQKINELARPLHGKADGGPRIFHEIQFDCDWTGQTKEKFFTLLEHFREEVQAAQQGQPRPVSLSATIRLHQLKFFEKTGVPPVDRGMLMFYNMGDLEAWETENSILDLETAEEYLTHHRYPIPLDLALPVFRWGVLFRDGRLTKLINNLGEEDLQDTLRFARTGPSRFEVKKSTYLQGYYLYKGDRLRLEQISTGQLEASVQLARQIFAGTGLTVAFYHLDTANLKAFPVHDLGAVLEKF